MSACPKGYDSATDCSRSLSMNSLLRASAIVATCVFLGVTVVLLICILRRRRVIFIGRFRRGDRRAQHPPALLIWSGSPAPPIAAALSQTEPAATNPSTGSKPVQGAGTRAEEPVSCVIMAGEERPTFLARPWPRDEFVEESLDLELEDLERGKHKATLIPSQEK